MNLDNTDRWVLTTFVFASVYILCYKFYLVHIHGLWSGAQTTGEILFATALSILAASIFYYITIYLQKRRSKSLVKDVIDRRLKQLNSDARFIMKAIYAQKGEKYSDKEHFPSPDEFKEKCNGIDLSVKAPNIWSGVYTHSQANWFEYFKYYYKRQEYHISVLFKIVHLLPVELIPVLDYLENNELYKALHYYELENTDKDMGKIANPLWVYLKILTEITPHNEHLAQWIKTHKLLLDDRYGKKEASTGH